MNWDKLRDKFKQECTYEEVIYNDGGGITVVGIKPSMDVMEIFNWIRKEVERPIIGIRVNHALTNKSELARELGLTISQFNGRLKNFRTDRFNEHETKELIEIFLEYFDYVFDRGE